MENPAWSTILRDSIKLALQEVLSSPELAVPPAFLHVRKGGKQPSVSPIKRKLLEIEQQVERLRSHERVRYEPRISSDEAEMLVRQYLQQGMPSELIVRRVAGRGAPSNWVERRVEELLRTVRPPAKVDQPPGVQPAPLAADVKQTEEKKAT